MMTNIAENSNLAVAAGLNIPLPDKPMPNYELTEENVKTAVREWLKDDDHSVDLLARVSNVGRSTIYNLLNDNYEKKISKDNQFALLHAIGAKINFDVKS